MFRQSSWPETPASYGLSQQPLIYFLREISRLKQKRRFADTSSLDGAGSGESQHQSSEAKQVSQLEGNQAFIQHQGSTIWGRPIILLASVPFLRPPSLPWQRSPHQGPEWLKEGRQYLYVHRRL